MDDMITTWHKLSDTHMGSVHPEPIVSLIGTDHLLRINAKDGALLVEVSLDGTLTFGDDYDPDDAAREFWIAIASLSGMAR